MLKKKKQNAKNWIFGNFKKAREEVVNNRAYSFLAFSIILLFAALGYIFHDFMIEQQEDFFENVIEGIPSDNLLLTILFIIQNNIKASFIAMSLGILVIIPFIALSLNGFIIGAVLNRGVEKFGPEIMLKLLPHGIFELPAICIAAGFGIKIALGIFRKENLAENYKQAFLVYIFIVLPLIIMAGIIEGILFYLTR